MTSKTHKTATEASTNGKLAVPADTAQLLAATQSVANRLRAELAVIAQLARGYCRDLGLDPDQPYDFTEENGKLYAKVRQVT